MVARPLGTQRRTQLDVQRRASTRSHVYAVLRRAIISLELLPGQALSENELAAAHSVSRTPVREALIRLADDGLVEVVPQLGTFVSRISVQDVREVQFIRETLERASLPHAIAALSRPSEKRLRRILAEQDEAEDQQDLMAFFGTDDELHRALLEVGGHPKVWPVVAAAKSHLDRVRMLALPDPGIVEELHTQHCTIIDHVIDKNLKAADATLKDHLRLVVDALEPLEARYPDYFTHE